MTLIAVLIAMLAIFVEQPAGEFADGVMAYCQPVVVPGTFIGCEASDWTLDETLYAGLLWQDGVPELVTGP